MTPEDFDKELRLFIKIILLQEYSPKLIEINMTLRSAVVTMESLKDLEEFFKKYAEHAVNNYPKFMVQPFIEPPQPVIQHVAYLPPNQEQFNPNLLVNQFGNISLRNFL